VPIALIALVLLAVGLFGNSPESSDGFTRHLGQMTYFYESFDDALTGHVTDVVIAQYVGHRPFGEHLTEFEFVVSDRIFGNAADRIFIYEENNIQVTVDGAPTSISYQPGEIAFTSDTDYLLPLWRVSSPYALIHDDGYRFSFGLVVDLDNPSNSTMFNDSLAPHSEYLDFDDDISREEIVSFVYERTRNNTLAKEFIRSEEMTDIIEGSPYILLVEINEPRRLSNAQGTMDWMSTDIYYVTLVQSLKGG
jgi:hypothetical protein